jgi:hypothetical protein
MPRKGQLHRRSRELGHVRNSAHNKGGIAISCHARFRTEVETKPNCFLLPQHVPNFLHSGRLTGASVAEQPLDAECVKFGEAKAWDKS